MRPIRTAAARDLGTLFHTGVLTNQSDAQLIERYTSRRDDAAFETLVGRHAPLVWNVCRRVLDDRRDAEDAFQATFLVLLDKAGSIRVGDSLGPWLRGVAKRVAKKARAAAIRKRMQERSLESLDHIAIHAPDDSSRAETNEQIQIIREEIDRLPEHWRLALSMCRLEGIGHEEAAIRLGVRAGTIKSRVARGTARLKSRLIRRGITLTTALLGSSLADHARGTIVPAALVEATVAAAARYAAGKTATVVSISTTVYLLTKGAVHSMFLTKLTTTLVMVAALGATGAGVGMIAYQGDGKSADVDPTQPGSVALQAPQPATPQPESPQVVNPGGAPPTATPQPESPQPPPQPRESARPDNQPVSREQGVDSNPAIDRQSEVGDPNDADQTTSPLGSLSAPTRDAGVASNPITDRNSQPSIQANDSPDKAPADRNPQTQRQISHINRMLSSEHNDVYLIEGDVVKPGRYALRKGVRVMDAMNLAGGFQSKGVNQSLVRKLKEAFESIPDLAPEDRDVLIKVATDTIQERRKIRGFWKATLIRTSDDPIIPEQTLPIYVQAIAHGEDTTNYLIKPGDRILLEIEQDNEAEERNPQYIQGPTRPDQPRTSRPDRPPVSPVSPRRPSR